MLFPRNNRIYEVVRIFWKLSLKKNNNFVNRVVLFKYENTIFFGQITEKFILNSCRRLKQGH